MKLTFDDINVTDLVASLDIDSFEEAFEFIKELDQQANDYEFTLSVVRHLISVLKSCHEPDEPPLTAKDIGL